MCWICNAPTSLSPATGQPAGRSMWSPRRAFLLAAGSAAAAPVLGQVDVGRSSSLRTLVPAEALEQASQKEYSELMAQARAQRALGPDNHPQVRRLRSIASRLIPHTAQWNDRARGWRWEVNLIGSQQINAYCMPGGKIAFFSGILDQLKLSDHEVAMIMGHEMATRCANTPASASPRRRPPGWGCRWRPRCSGWGSWASWAPTSAPSC